MRLERITTILLIFFLLSSSIFAQSSILDNFQDKLDNLNYNGGNGVYGEVSQKFLNQLVGYMPKLMSYGYNTSYMLSTVATWGILKVFTTSVFVIAVIIANITIIQAVLSTAMEGEFMGRKLPKFFIILRTVAALTLFLPTSGGYTILQTLINQVALQGIALANGAWTIVASLMLMYNGGIGHILAGTGSLSKDFPNQYYKESSANISSGLSEVAMGELRKYVASSPSDDWKDKIFLMITASSMCSLVKIDTGSGDEMLAPYTVDGKTSYRLANTLPYTEKMDDMYNSLLSRANWTKGSNSYSKIIYFPDQYDGSSRQDDNNVCGAYRIDVSIDQFNTLVPSLVTALKKISRDTIYNMYIPYKDAILTGGEIDDGKFKTGMGCINNCTETKTGSAHDLMPKQMVQLADGLAAQSSLIQLMSAQISPDNNSKKDDLEDLIDGGWAMMANQYSYFAKKLDSYGSGPTASAVKTTITNQASPLSVSSVIESYPGEKTTAKKLIDAYWPSLANATYKSYEGYASRAKTSTAGTESSGYTNGFCSAIKKEDGSTTTTESSEDIKDTVCNNINNYIFTYNPNPEAKSTPKTFYQSFKYQLVDLDNVKTFVEIGKESIACALPFGPGDNCGAQMKKAGTAGADSTSGEEEEEEEEGKKKKKKKKKKGLKIKFKEPTAPGKPAAKKPSMEPVSFGDTIATMAVALGVVVLGFAIGFFRIIGITLFFLLDLPYFAMMGAAQNWVDLFHILTSPDKLYPRSLALDIQAYTYFLIKAWYDTFIFNQTALFVFPIQSLSIFGVRSMAYSIAFIFRIATDTFVSLFSTNMDHLMRKVYTELLFMIVNMYSGSVLTYGEMWFNAHFANPLPWGPWLLTWFNEFVKKGLLVPPVQPGIFCVPINYICIPVPFFLIVIPLHMFIGVVLMAIGYVMQMLVMLKQILNIIDVSDMIIEIQNFITTRYNPIYFGIAVPMIVLSSTFAFFIPMYPIVIYSLTVLGYMVLYMEAIVAAPLIMIGIIYPDGHTFFGKADKLLHLLLLIYIRPVLIVIGFVMANVIASVSVVLLYETGVPLLNKQIGAWVSGYAMISSSEVNGSAANEMVTAVITILSLYMFIYMYYQVMLYSFSIIYRLPNAVNRWVGIPPSSSEQEDQARVEELAEGFKGMSSQLAQAGTEVAGSYGSITQTVNPMSAQKSTKSAMRKDASGQGAQMGKQLSSKGGDDD